MNDNNVLFTIEGCADDLLSVSMPDNNLTMKTTRLIDIDPYEKDPDAELVDIAITSTCGNGKHKVFDSLLGKTIKITIEEITPL